MDQPRWLDIAWAELGQREMAGKANNARILEYYSDAGHPEVTHDEVAWCAAFVGACLIRAGLSGTGSLMARSYLAWGAPLDGPRIGAIAILPRGSDPASGHVGFVAGVTTGSILLLAGNQGDAVSVQRFSKSQVLGYRWPSSEHTQPDPTASSAYTVDNAFEHALAHVLEMEGGWSEDPYDPGGPTNKGITLGTYAAYKGIAVSDGNFSALKQELRSIGEDTVRTIYRQRYWKPCRAAELPAGLALIHFDAAVNHGVGASARILQEAVGAAIDGEIGPLTLSAAHATAQTRSLQAYAEIRRRRYRALPHFWRFGRGWLARVDKSLARALSRLDVPNPTPKASQSKETETMAEQEAMRTATTTIEQDAKWWGESMTIWGALLTALTTVLPVLGPLIGIDVTGDMVRQIGDQAVKAIQAIGGLMGTILTIYGRTRANTRIERKDVSLRL